MTSTDIKSAVAEVMKDAHQVNYASRNVCLQNLAFVYHLVIASEDLLCLAIEQSQNTLRTYFKSHLEEEEDHAKWLLSDLSTAGFNIGISPKIAVAMVGSLFYLIRYVDPCALLGYMVLMECFSAPMAHIEALEVMHGPEMFRTLRHHAEHDPAHGAEVLAQIDKLTDEQRVVVMDCAVQSARYMAIASHTFK